MMNGFIIETKSGFKPTHLKKGDRVIFHARYNQKCLIVTFERNLQVLHDGRDISPAGMAKKAELYQMKIYNKEDFANNLTLIQQLVRLMSGLYMKILARNVFKDGNQCIESECLVYRLVTTE